MAGDKVTLVVAKALPILPDVRQKTEAEARSLLERVGLVVTVSYRQTNTVTAGRVISQTPAAGTAYLAGARVTLEVAKALPTLPKVIGKTEAVARQTLEKMGLKVSVTYNRNTADTIGHVSRQIPAPGNAFQTGDKVTLTVDKALPVIIDELPTPTLPTQPRTHVK